MYELGGGGGYKCITTVYRRFRDWGPRLINIGSTGDLGTKKIEGSK